MLHEFYNFGGVVVVYKINNTKTRRNIGPATVPPALIFPQPVRSLSSLRACHMINAYLVHPELPLA